MIKNRIKAVLPNAGLAQLRAMIQWQRRLRSGLLRIANSALPPLYVNVGAGANSEALRWWTGDYQDGVVFDEHYRFPLADRSVAFVYSSMFFEHVNDAVAESLFREFKRILRPGGGVRIVVPDFWLYLERYRAGDEAFFRTHIGPNVDTWGTYDVSDDLEHLFVGIISAIDNLPHVVVSDLSRVDMSATPPRVGFPVQNYLPGYYCGPAPEMTTQQIKIHLEQDNYNDFLTWVFEVTSQSRYQNPVFNSWHKNYWDYTKTAALAAKVGFDQTTQSLYGKSPMPLPPFIEKPQHQPIGLYFNIS